MTGLTFDHAASGRSTRIAGLAAVIALHLVVVFLLLQFEPVRSAFTPAIPITVSLISLPKTVEPVVPPQPLPMKPRTHKSKPMAASQVTMVNTDKPAEFVAPPSMPAPEPALAAASEPVAAAPPTAYIASAPPAPVAVTPPSFNAAYLNNPPPRYPTLSRRMNEEGRAVLRVFVDERGFPAEVQMRTSSGHPRLDEAALTTVRQWKFVPARRGDVPVGAWVLVPISFTLRS